jgi:hypothetical protein
MNNKPIKVNHATTGLRTSKSDGEKMRKNKKRWRHYKIADFKAFGFKAICGRNSPEEIDGDRTIFPNAVTCPRCIDKLKEKFWFCEICGFIDDKNVTFEETCEKCGSKLIQD